MRQYNTSNETFSDTHMDDPRFYKHDDGCCFIKTSYHDGVLPAILGKLAKARKVYKKEMMRFERLAFDAVVGSKERAEYAFNEKVFNAKQLAAKVSMNSVYGFAGVQNHG
jgi:DNA polymerase elongation subunit (family B)